MSLTIRLSRIGRKNQPAYKLVVSNTRDKRNGKYVDILGHFNPFDSQNKFSYDKEKYEKWVKNGALVTEAVKKLLENKEEEKKEETDQTPVEESKEEIQEDNKGE